MPPLGLKEVQISGAQHLFLPHVPSWVQHQKEEKLRQILFKTLSDLNTLSMKNKN